MCSKNKYSFSLFQEENSGRHWIITLASQCDSDFRSNMTKWGQDCHMEIPSNGYLWPRPVWNFVAWHGPVARQPWWWDHGSLPQQSCAPAQVNNPAALSRQRAVNTVFSLCSESYHVQPWKVHSALLLRGICCLKSEETYLKTKRSPTI